MRDDSAFKHIQMPFVYLLVFDNIESQESGIQQGAKETEVSALRILSSSQ